MNDEEWYAMFRKGPAHLRAEIDSLREETERFRTAIAQWIRNVEAVGQAGAADMMRAALEAPNAKKPPSPEGEGG